MSDGSLRMKKIGVIGAGQLGQMLGMAGSALDLECVFLDPSDHPPAASVGRVLQYAFDSQDGLRQLADLTDLITYEFENVPVTALNNISASTPVYPPAAALMYAQDRLAEKKLFGSINIPVAEYLSVDCVEDLRTAADQIGLPIVLKTRRLGYDGKGQRVVRHTDEISAAVTDLGSNNLIAEQWVAFDREISIIGARNVSGDIRIYPLSENVHSNGILSVSTAPADAAGLADVADRYLTDLLQELQYVGILALELFVVGDRLLANEFAPRVHNSGHWTIEGAAVSQFENHLRAILNLPLGDTSMRGYAGMLNLIGAMPDKSALDLSANCHWHDYGKSARPGRKLGHATIVTESPENRDQEVRKLAKALGL